MTAKELEQIIPLQKEIAYLKSKLRQEVITDSVQGSYSEEPYTKHSVKISGLSKQGIRLSGQIKSLEVKRAELVRWIDIISDRQTKLIFQYRYIEGFTWAKIAGIIGGGNTEGSCRKRAKRYLKKFQIF